MNFMGVYSVDLFDCPPFGMVTFGDCPRSINILEQKRFEPESMRLWCELARTATSILDIGAHVGVYSLAAASLRKDIPIHAFEPNPYAYSRLREHILLNGFRNIVEHHQALAHRGGEASFCWVLKPGKPISSGGYLGTPGAGVESVIVQTAPLDDIPIAYGERPLVKIDVEGAERYVLEGAQALLAVQPDIIIESFSQKNCDAITELLPPGYKVFRIIEDGRLEPIDRLTAADGQGRDFNQFVTWRETSRETVGDSTCT